MGGAGEHFAAVADPQIPWRTLSDDLQNFKLLNCNQLINYNQLIFKKAFLSDVIAAHIRSTNSHMLIILLINCFSGIK